MNRIEVHTGCEAHQEVIVMIDTNAGVALLTERRYTATVAAKGGGTWATT